MTVAELIQMLEKYPPDMEVIHEMFSDYYPINEGGWSIVEGVPKDEWIMRAHPTMSEENKALAKKYLKLEGN